MVVRNTPNYNNKITIKLEEEGQIKRLSNVTRMQLILNSEIIADSDVDPTIFDFTTDAKIIYIELGLITELDGEGFYKPHLIVFDTINTDGIDYGKITIYTDIS